MKPLIVAFLLALLGGCAASPARYETADERCERMARAMGHFAAAATPTGPNWFPRSELAKREAYHRELAQCRGQAVVVSPGPVIQSPPAPQYVPAPPVILQQGAPQVEQPQPPSVGVIYLRQTDPSPGGMRCQPEVRGSTVYKRCTPL
ncbi:MAG: hypothetical protein ACREVR_05970 [Burkholderiales bacterium]